MEKNWKTRVLWFVSGMIVACFFALIVPARTVPTQDVQQQINSLERRVQSLEAFRNQIGSSVYTQPQQTGPSHQDRSDRDPGTNH